MPHRHLSRCLNDMHELSSSSSIFNEWFPIFIIIIYQVTGKSIIPWLFNNEWLASKRKARSTIDFFMSLDMAHTTCLASPSRVLKKDSLTLLRISLDLIFQRRLSEISNGPANHHTHLELILAWNTIVDCESLQENSEGPGVICLRLLRMLATN